jgi:hypothetical protein
LRFFLDDDVDILVQGSQEVDKPLDRKPLQLVIDQRRYFWLIDSQLCGGGGLGQVLACD